MEIHEQKMSCWIRQAAARDRTIHACSSGIGLGLGSSQQKCGLSGRLSLSPCVICFLLSLSLSLSLLPKYPYLHACWHEYTDTHTCIPAYIRTFIPTYVSIIYIYTYTSLHDYNMHIIPWASKGSAGSHCAHLSDYQTQIWSILKNESSTGFRA